MNVTTGKRLKGYSNWTKETRGKSYQLKTKKPRLAIRKNFFAVAAVADWNSLPETVVRCDNVNVFKKFRQTLGTQNVQHRVPCEKWTHMKELIDRGCGLQIRKEPVNIYFPVSYREHRRNFIKELKNQKIDETLVSLLNCKNKHVISALAGFIASID